MFFDGSDVLILRDPAWASLLIQTPFRTRQVRRTHLSTRPLLSAFDWQEAAIDLSGCLISNQSWWEQRRVVGEDPRRCCRAALTWNAHRFWQLETCTTACTSCNVYMHECLKQRVLRELMCWTQNETKPQKKKVPMPSFIVTLARAGSPKSLWPIRMSLCKVTATFCWVHRTLNRARCLLKLCTKST